MTIASILKDLFMDKEFQEKIKFLKSISLFDGLNNNSLGKILNIMYEKTYQPNEHIFEEEKTGKALFIIRSGEVAIIRKTSSGEEKVITTLKEGNFFGEMALLEELPRSATAKTVTQSTIFLIYKVKFDNLIEKHPREGVKIVHNLAKVLSSRLRETDEFYTKK